MDPTSLLVAVVGLTDEKKPGTGNICTYHDASTLSLLGVWVGLEVLCRSAGVRCVL